MTGDCEVFGVVGGVEVLWEMLLWNGRGEFDLVGRIVGNVVDLFYDL